MVKLGLSVSLSKELLVIIDNARGLATRSAFIEFSLKKYLETKNAMGTN